MSPRRPPVVRGKKGSSSRSADALKDATLAVDIGSTACRLLLLPVSSGTESRIGRDPSAESSRYGQWDHSTSFYPDGRGKPYAGNAVDLTKFAASLKPVFLLLSGLSPENLTPLIREYPHAEDLQRRMDGNSAFRQRLALAVAQFLDYLRTRTMKTCEADFLRVTQIAISVPAQWPPEVRDYMAEVFHAKFSGGGHLDVSGPERVFFHTETQALAHYHFKHHARDLMGGSKSKVFLLADFGGQNLAQSGGNDGPPAFFEIGTSRGIVGGGELHDHRIGEYCRTYLEGIEPEMTDLEQQQLANKFHVLKKDLDSDDDIDGDEELLSLHHGRLYVRLTPEIIRNAFYDALGPALEALEDSLDKWTDWEGPPEFKLIVAGGTARSLSLKHTLRDMCRSRSLGRFKFSEDLDKPGRDRSLKVALGAAYATTNSLTISEFVSRGAAIGAQFQEEGKGVWNDTALILVHMKEEKEQEWADIKPHDKVKLICDPFLHKPKRGEVDSVHSMRSYDFYDVGVLKEGKAQLKASFVIDGDEDTPKHLVFSLNWRPRLNRDPVLGDFRSGVIYLPLRIDRSSGCVLVVEDKVRGYLPPEAFVSLGDTLADTSALGTSLEHERPPQIAPLANMEPDPTASNTTNSNPDRSDDHAEGGRRGQVASHDACVTDTYPERPKPEFTEVSRMSYGGVSVDDYDVIVISD